MLLRELGGPDFLSGEQKLGALRITRGLIPRTHGTESRPLF